MVTPLGTDRRRHWARLGTKLGSAAAAGLAPLAAVRTALAHGGVVGPQDWMQDYGGTIFLAAAVVAGGAVVVWLLRTPVQSDDDVSDSSSGAHKEPERAT